MSASLKPLTLNEFLDWERIQPDIDHDGDAMLELPEISVSIPMAAIYGS
jgi:hypothetical protein